MLHVQIKGLIVIFREITTFFFFLHGVTFKIYTSKVYI